jgi:hypothetical protein
VTSSSQDGQVQADALAENGAESGNSRGLVRPFSTGESVVAAVASVVLWALVFLGLSVLDLGRGASGLLATAGVIAVAYGMLRRSLGKVSCAVHFVTGLSEANSWKQWGELIATHATLVPYTLKTQATDEAGSQVLRILRVASRLQLDKTTAWTDAETSRLVDALGYTPRLPLSEAFLPFNSLTDEQNETLGRLQNRIDRGDTAGFSESMPSLHELLGAYEEPVDRNWYDIALVVAHVHVLLGTKEDLDQASAMLRRMKHVFVMMHPQEDWMQENGVE